MSEAGKRASGEAVGPSVSVIVVAFNAGPHLRRCLDCLARQSFRNFETIIVDNGSTDGSLAAAHPLPLPATVLEPGRNLGFAAANNLAAGQARGAWLALLNADAFPAPDWLEQLMAAVARHPSAAMFGSTQLMEADPGRLDGAGDPYHPLGLAWRGDRGRPAEAVTADGVVFGPCAAAALYRRDRFLDAGGFDSAFFCFYEDVDLAFRLRLRGEYCVQVARARVRHVGSATAGRRPDQRQYLISRNRLWVLLRNMPGPLLWALLPPAAALILLRLLQAALAGRPGPRARALRDALRALPRIRRERAAIQGARTVSSMELAGAMTWSLARLATGRADIRPAGRPARWRPRRLPAGDMGHVGD